jgi:hypothetical protein
MEICYISALKTPRWHMPLSAPLTFQQRELPQGLRTLCILSDQSSDLLWRRKMISLNTMMTFPPDAVLVAVYKQLLPIGKSFNLGSRRLCFLRYNGIVIHRTSNPVDVSVLEELDPDMPEHAGF